MKILVVCDDVWHPGEVIRRGLAPLAVHGFEFDFVSDAKDILTVDMLNDYEVMIVAKGNAHSAANSGAEWFENGVTAVMPRDITEWVRRGGGLLSLHAGNCFRRDNCPDMTALTGNSFITHPKQCTIRTEFTTKHPILEGAEEFSFRDEHYCIEMLADDVIMLFHTVSDSAGIQPGGYVRNVGEGRVCVLTPGHNCAVLRNPNYAKILVNAVLWCAKKK